MWAETSEQWTWPKESREGFLEQIMPDLGSPHGYKEQKDNKSFPGTGNKPNFFSLEDWSFLKKESLRKSLKIPPMTKGQKENPYASSTLRLDILHQFKNYLCKGKKWRSPCGFGRCFPSESLLHNTQAEPHWVSLAQAKIKPCSNLSVRGEKWRLCASDARIIKLTFVNSVVLLVYRQPSQRTWKCKKVWENPGAGFQN